MDETQANVPDLLRDNVSLLYWLGKRMLRPVRSHTPDDVDEFVSELTLLALKKKDQFDPAKGKFSTWMHWQARCVRSRLNLKNRLTWTPEGRGGEEVSAIDLTGVDQEPSMRVENAETSENVRQSFHEAMLKLPGNLRSVARSVLVRGTSLRELAAMRGVRKVAVEQNFRRAKARLKRSMAKDLKKF